MAHDLIIRNGTDRRRHRGADRTAPTSPIDGDRITAIGDLTGDDGDAARSTPRGSSSRPASSTCTRTSTRRSPGTR